MESEGLYQLTFQGQMALAKRIGLRIVFPPAGQPRMRTVVSRSRTRSTSKYPSFVMGRMVQAESPHERNAFTLLDVWPGVRAFTEQPCIIHYTIDGESFRHVPDILVEFPYMRELWEVKTATDAARTEIVARTRLLAHTLPALGYAYRLAIAEELARQPRLGNAETIRRLGQRHSLSVGDREWFRRFFSDAGAVTWADAEDGHLGPKGKGVLCRLVLERSLTFDWGQPITRTTQFSPLPAAL